MSKRSCEAVGVSSTSSLYHSKSLPAPGMAVKAGTICTRLPAEEVLCVRSSCSRMQTGMFSLSHHKPLVRTLVELFTLTLDNTPKSACWETRKRERQRDEGQEKAETQWSKASVGKTGIFQSEWRNCTHMVWWPRERPSPPPVPDDSVLGLGPLWAGSKQMPELDKLGWARLVR